MATKQNNTPTTVTEDTKKRPGRKPGSKAKVTVQVNGNDVKEVPQDDSDIVIDNYGEELFIDHDSSEDCGGPIMAMNSNALPMVDIGPYADVTYEPRSSIKTQSNYFKAILDKASKIIKALGDSDMYVGSVRIGSMILSAKGQFVVFYNKDQGIGSDTIELECYYPYMNGDNLSILHAGNTTIESPESIKAKVNRILEIRTNTHAVPNQYARSCPTQYGYGYNNNFMYQSMPVPQCNNPNIVKSKLSMFDYVNGLCMSKLYGEPDKTWYPVCIWDLTYIDSCIRYNKSIPEVDPRFTMTEKAALKMLKGKPFPLIFAGTVPEETI